MEKTRNQVTYIKKRIVRVIVRYKNGGVSTGTGFLISDHGDLLTCFHVVFGGELRNIRSNQIYITTTGTDEHSKLQNYFTQILNNIEVELPDGTKKQASIKDFNETFDIASVKLDSNDKTLFFQIDTKYSTEYDESTFFCGFQMATGYSNHEQYPFATNRAVVSSFPETIVGGDKYSHVQLNSINLGGNSGAPLFTEGGKKVIGIVNGNMNWGNDSVMINDPKTNQPEPKSLRVPLSIAYATSLKTIKDETSIL